MRTALIPLIFGLFVALPACKSVETMVEEGDYERTIEVAQRRLVGKDRKNPRYVDALERAVNRANANDLTQIDRLRQAPATDWVRIHNIYSRIQRRQDKLAPLLPLEDRNGWVAEFNIVPTAAPLAEAARGAAAQLYDRAGEQLAAGRRGDKAAARAAYATLEDIGRFEPRYRDTDSLLDEAAALGHVYVSVVVENQSGSYLPPGFNDILLDFAGGDLDGRWHTFDFRTDPNQEYDYFADITLTEVLVSPEREEVRTYVDEREITDGTEYVLDARGNVARDSLGNDITRPRRVWVRAEVTEILQTKSARVAGAVRITDRRSGRVVDEDALATETVYENFSGSFRGDRRALSDESRRNLGNRPRPFPADEDLILDAAAELKPRLRDRLRDSYRLL